MKNSKPRTVLKPIRIPEKVVKEIEQEASSRNTTFSDIDNYRLQHHQNPLTPELLAKIQDICNHAIEAVKNNSLAMAKTTELEVSLLWKFLKLFYTLTADIHISITVLIMQWMADRFLQKDLV